MKYDPESTPRASAKNVTTRQRSEMISCFQIRHTDSAEVFECCHQQNAKLYKNFVSTLNYTLLFLILKFLRVFAATYP